MAIYLRYILGLAFFFWGFWFRLIWVFLFLGFFLYLVWAVLKNYNYVKRRKAIFLLPVLQIVSDFSIMTGFARGIFPKK